MGKRKMVQQMLFAEKDSPLAVACDKFLECRDGLEAAKQALETGKANLVLELEKARRTSVKHGGRVFSMRQTDPKVSITVKE